MTKYEWQYHKSAGIRSDQIRSSLSSVTNEPAAMLCFMHEGILSRNIFELAICTGILDLLKDLVVSYVSIEILSLTANEKNTHLQHFVARTQRVNSAVLQGLVIKLNQFRPLEIFEVVGVLV